MANLLEKASILITPTAYDVGSINAIKPIETIGDELVTNGDFATDSDWTKGTNCTIENGKAKYTNSPSGQGFTQSNFLTIGKNYKVTFTVSDFSLGSVKIRFPFNSTNTITSNGTYTEYGVATSDELFFQNVGNTTLSIDNVSVKEITNADLDFTRATSGSVVGTALRENANGVLETVIPDVPRIGYEAFQYQEVLGSELVTNGDFSQEGSELVTNGDFDTAIPLGTAGAGWTFIDSAQDGSSAEYYNGGVRVTKTTNQSRLRPVVGNTTDNNFLPEEELDYVVTYEILSSSGNSTLSLNLGSSGYNLTSSVGTHTYYLKSGGGAIVQFSPKNDSEFVIDNVSIKEVGQGFTFGDGWSVDQENSKAIYDDTLNGFTLTDNILTIGKNYLVQFNILDTGGNTIRLSVNSDSGGDFRDYADGDGLFTKVITAATNYLRIGGGTSGVSFSITNVSVKEVTQELVPDSGSGHWLIEPEARNTATYSNDFTQGTLFNGGNGVGSIDAVLTSAQATSPDGNNNAWKFADNDDGNSGSVTLHYFGTNVNSGDYNVVSLFVKKQGKNDWFRISRDGYDDAFANAFFDISNGTLGTVDSTLTANIEDYGDGWYRISVAFTTTTNVIGAVIFRLAEDDNDITFTRNGTYGTYIYGIQAESTTNQYSTKPTSYIPTSGSQVTRAEDGFGLNTTLDTSLINSTEGTFYAEMAALDNNLVDRNISLSDGDDNNTIRFRYRTTSNSLQVSVKVGTAQASFSTASFDITNFLKISLRFKENDFACFVNGSQVGVTDTNGTTFPVNTLNKIKSTRGDGAFDFAGKIKCIAVFKEGLTDSELTCLTT